MPASGIALDLRGSLLRAFARAAGLVLGLGAIVGAALFGLAALPVAVLPFYGAGVAVALVAGLATLLLHGRFLDPKAIAPFARDGRLLSQRLQSLLAAAFGAKLAILVLAFFLMRALGMKFADTTTFAITFAAAALLCQLATALSLARALQPRTSSSGLPAGTGVSGSDVP
jgi:hypothetical protein